MEDSDIDDADHIVGLMCMVVHFCVFKSLSEKIVKRLRENDTISFLWL